MPLFIQTPRFVIREFKPEEQGQFLSIFDDKRVIVHLPKRNRQDYIDLFKTTLEDYTAGKVLGRWGIFNNGDGEMIGFCLLRPFDKDKEGRVELGYVLIQKYWGKGIAGEMARIMVVHGFMNTGADELVAVTTLGNIGSQQVLLKAGMTRMENINRDGQELAFFSIEKDSDIGKSA